MGSEMCIRDRDGGVALGELAALKDLVEELAALADSTQKQDQFHQAFLG